MGDILSAAETQPVQPGQVVVNVGADIWKTWANASNVTGAIVGVVSIGGRPGTPISVVTSGRFPYHAFNLGAGNATSIVAGFTPSRGSTGTVLGVCDPSGELFIYPTQIGQATAPEVSVPSVGTVALLRGQAPTAANAVMAQSFQTAGDGGGGLFVWNPNDTRADDGYTILQWGSQPGRWNKLVDGDVIDWRCFGVVPDLQAATDGAMSSTVNPTTLTCNTSQPFANATAGMLVVVMNAGAAGVPLPTTIATVVSPSTVTLANAAQTTINGATVLFGTKNHAAIAAALAN